MQRLVRFLLAIAGILYWVVIISFFAIHLWSIKMLYDWYGIIAAIIGFFMLVATEIFCFVHLVFYHHESVFALYPLVIISYIIAFILMVGLFVLATNLHERGQNK